MNLFSAAFRCFRLPAGCPREGEGALAIAHFEAESMQPAVDRAVQRGSTQCIARCFAKSFDCGTVLAAPAALAIACLESFCQQLRSTVSLCRGCSFSDGGGRPAVARPPAAEARREESKTTKRQNDKTTKRQFLKTVIQFVTGVPILLMLSLDLEVCALCSCPC